MSKQLVNITNPDTESKQKRVLALTSDGITAVTAKGVTVTINPDDVIKFNESIQTHTVSYYKKYNR